MHTKPDYALYQRIYDVVEHVPCGMVSTYGDIATIVGGGCDARTVGYAMNELPPERITSVPWHRIINREGGISTRGSQQRQLLEDEGIIFDTHNHVLMARFRWSGPQPDWAHTHGFHTLPLRNDGEQLTMF